MAIAHRNPTGWNSALAAIGGVGVLAGLANGFEILIVGEELSTLGSRTHSALRFASDNIHYLGELIAGLLALGLSIARGLWIVGFCQGRSWAFRWGAALSFPFALLDLACWSLPLAAILVTTDMYQFGRCFRGVRH